LLSELPRVIYDKFAKFISLPFILPPSVYLGFFRRDLENKQTRETYQLRKGDFLYSLAYNQLQFNDTENEKQKKTNQPTNKQTRYQEKKDCRPLKNLKFAERYLLTTLYIAS